MATIIENKKDGKVVSYKFRAYLGKQQGGKQVAKYHTWQVPNGLTPAKARKAAEKAAAEWEKEARFEYERDVKEPERAAIREIENQRTDFVGFVDGLFFPVCLYDGNHKQTTITYYESLSKGIKTYFKGYTLQTIAPIDIKKYLIYLQTKHRTPLGNTASPKTVRHIYCLLAMIFKFAKEQDYIVKNPIDKVDCPKLVKKKVDALTKEEAAAFFAAVDDCPIDFQCKIAKQRLEEIVTKTKVKVIGLSATPIRAVCEMKCKSRFVKIDDNIRQFETDKRFTYTNLEMLLPSLGLAERGLVYIGRIHQMKEFEEKAKQRGIKVISIWSVNNQDHPMTEEQRRVRDYILTNAALPPEYDMFIINASSETSINIFGDLDYIIIHNQEEETQIQVRGRYRDDLDSLYVLNYDCVPYVPAEFMGVKLFTEDKKRLCEALSLRQDDGKKKAWPSTKEALIEDGYTITEGRQNCKRFAIITR